MLYPSLSRGELENRIEDELVKLLEDMRGDGKNDLQKAFDRDPIWFGGEFPSAGAFVIESRGTGSAQDRGDRPSTIEARIMFYEPCMPVRGAESKDDDRISRAKRITRALRDKLLLDLQQKNPRLYSVADIRESRGASADEFGISRVTEPGDRRGRQQEILWVDRTTIEFSV